MYSDRQLRFFQLQHDRVPEGRFWIPLADQLIHCGRLDEARRLLETGLQAWPASVSGRWILARCLEAAGDLDAAREATGVVLAHDPAHAEARILQDALAARCAVEQKIVPEPPADPPEPRAPDRADLLQAEKTMPSLEVVTPPAAEAVPSEPEATETPQPVAEEAPAATPTPVTLPVRPSVHDADRGVSDPAGDSRDGSPGEDPTPTFVTRTLADIYLEQGHRDKALQILRQVLAVHPDRDDITSRIHAIEQRQSPDESTPVIPDREAANRERFDAWLRREAGGGE